VHLRLARLSDLGAVAAFLERHGDSPRSVDRPNAELSVLLRGHVDTVIVALRDRALEGVALCGVTRGRARLIELVVEPGREQAGIERRLLRRSLRNLRTLGVGTLDFGSGANANTRAGPATTS
jgi:N-acetylglutamate synthase-like GNAT family acetyltransferase